MPELVRILVATELDSERELCMAEHGQKPGESTYSYVGFVRDLVKDRILRF